MNSETLNRLSPEALDILKPIAISESIPDGEVHRDGKVYGYVDSRGGLVTVEKKTRRTAEQLVNTARKNGMDKDQLLSLVSSLYA